MMREKADLRSDGEQARTSPLMVNSVEKAFRVLAAFDGSRPSLSLSEIAAATGLDMSAAQRFAYTLTQLGILRKSPHTRRLELTVKALDLGYHYTRSSFLVKQGMPYLMHLSKTTEETVNLTVLDDVEIVFVARFMSRHVLNNDVIIGTRLPAYCTGPGTAILSRMPKNAVHSILDRSDLRPYTPSTVWGRAELLRRIGEARQSGFAMIFEEYFYGDLSIAAPVLDPNGSPIGAINLAVSRSRYSPEQAVKKFSAIVMSAAQSISMSSVYET